MKRSRKRARLTVSAETKQNTMTEKTVPAATPRATVKRVKTVPAATPHATVKRVKHVLAVTPHATHKWRPHKSQGAHMEEGVMGLLLQLLSVKSTRVGTCQHP
ncbi:hypothetical protein PR003_g6563 [Phytophthora rubi]|uniref:Uncharacterized protein n=1 Tax=Phytophthora rubi TaxID=129364 RepID=A0A6A4FGG1_9STRA|nr:hypothetical protein PR003_g6563 [Phytophthora rubi]